MPVLNETVVKELPIPTDKPHAIHWFSGAMVEGRAVPSGFGVSVQRSGVRSFILFYRVGQQQRWMTIGRVGPWSVLAAVREARLLRQRVDRGGDPLAERKEARKPPEPPQPERTVGEVLDEFVAVHVEKRLRRPDNYRATFERLVKPAIGAAAIYGLRRSRIATMLDEIEANSGAIMADRTLAYLSSALNWYGERDDDFAPPRLRGLKRARGRSRDRVLSDDEVRAVWRAAEANGTYGALVRFLLLTGQRRGDAYGMEWSELEGATWTIPAERYKTEKAHTVELSGAAMAIVEAQPHTGRLVFPGDKGRQMGTGSSRKAALDNAITKANGGKPLARWTIHDTRRTARSLMARAGVRSEIAERVIGHTIRGVEGVYDRHTYASDKRAALESLSRLIEQILNPSPANVVRLKPGAG